MSRWKTSEGIVASQRGFLKDKFSWFWGLGQKFEKRIPMNNTRRIKNPNYSKNISELDGPAKIIDSNSGFKKNQSPNKSWNLACDRMEGKRVNRDKQTPCEG